MNDATIYKFNKSFLWGVLFLFCIVFFGLTLPRLIEGTLETRHLQGLAGFYLLILAIGITPFFAKLEVGKDFVKSYCFGFCTTNIERSKVIVSEYGNLMRFGGLGFGKGLKIVTEGNDGSRKYYSIAESNCGVEAVNHARRVLEGE